MKTRNVAGPMIVGVAERGKMPVAELINLVEKMDCSTALVWPDGNKEILHSLAFIVCNGSGNVSVLSQRYAEVTSFREMQMNRTFTMWSGSKDELTAGIGSSDKDNGFLALLEFARKNSQQLVEFSSDVLFRVASFSSLANFIVKVPKS